MKASHSALVTRLRVELDRADQRAVRRLLVVEMKAVVGMADGVDALVERDPVIAAARRGGKLPGRIVGRRNRILREGVQDVGQHQFLMLLLVIEADLDQRREAGEGVLVGGLEEFHDGRVDMAAIGGDFVRAPGGSDGRAGGGHAGGRR